MKAVQITEFGGPEVLQHLELDDPVPGEGETLITVTRSGVNFADTHVTRDDYLAKQELPVIPGGEISGRTPDGDRVAAMLMNGGYAEKVVVPDAALSRCPMGSTTTRPPPFCSRGSRPTAFSASRRTCRRASRLSSQRPPAAPAPSPSSSPSASAPAA